MAKTRKKSAGRSRKTWKGCGCPSGSSRVSTKGHGRGWVCIKRGKPYRTRAVPSKVVTPTRFVRASC